MIGVALDVGDFERMQSFVKLSTSLLVIWRMSNHLSKKQMTAWGLRDTQSP